MLLTVGLGALAGTATWVLRETASSRRAERAATLARTRMEMLRLAPCTTGSGVVAHADLIDRWTLSLDAHRAVAVVSVVARDSGRMPEQRYQAGFRC